MKLMVTAVSIFVSTLIVNSIYCLPDGFSRKVVADNVEALMIDIAPDGRVFFTDKTGRVFIIKDDERLNVPFLDIRDDVNNNGEMGLIGIAIDPDFIRTPWVYILFTHDNGRAYIERVKADGDVADMDSRERIFDLEQKGDQNWHAGGDLAFGNDGKLYASRGEVHNSGNANNKNSIRGSIIRINKDGSIPNDNPFHDENSGDARAVYLYGVRNPFNITFQPGTDRMYFNDVQGPPNQDEINEGKAGAGYEYGGGGDTNPIYQWGGDGPYALMGGMFYNKKAEGHLEQWPEEYHGKYFFSNHRGSRQIRYLDPENNNNASTFDGDGANIDFALHPMGHVYASSHDKRTVVKITYDEMVEDPIVGCVHPEANNYAADAQLDDGSCDFSIITAILKGSEDFNMAISEQSLVLSLKTSQDFNLMLYDLQGRIILSHSGRGPGVIPLQHLGLMGIILAVMSSDRLSVSQKFLLPQ